MSRRMYFDYPEKRDAWFRHNILDKICPANCRMYQFADGHYYSEHQSLVSAIYSIDSKDFGYSEAYIHPLYKKVDDRIIYGFEVVAKRCSDAMVYKFTDKELHQITIAQANMRKRIALYDNEAKFLYIA